MFLLILESLVALACFSAGVSQLVINRNALDDLPILQAARRLTGFGLLIAAGYIFYALFVFGQANAVLCLVLAVLALGQILFAMHAAFEPASTNRLMGMAQASPSLQRKQRSETSHA